MSTLTPDEMQERQARESLAMDRERKVIELAEQYEKQGFDWITSVGMAAIEIPPIRFKPKAATKSPAAEAAVQRPKPSPQPQPTKAAVSTERSQSVVEELIAPNVGEIRQQLAAGTRPEHLEYQTANAVRREYRTRFNELVRQKQRTGMNVSTAITRAHVENPHFVTEMLRAEGCDEQQIKTFWYHERMAANRPLA